MAYDPADLAAALQTGNTGAHNSWSSFALLIRRGPITGKKFLTCCPDYVLRPDTQTRPSLRKRSTYVALIRRMFTSPALGPATQWHWPVPRSRTSPFGAAVNSHAYPRLVSCRRSTPSCPVIRTLLVGRELRNL